MSTPNYKFVLVGDGAVGKTCLLYVFSKGEYPTDYVPTIVDNFTVALNVDGRKLEIQLWDTAGQENFEKLRLLSYPDADVIIMCFSLLHPFSLDNIVTKWSKEVREHNTKAKIILVGTKADQLNDPKIIEELKGRGEAPPTEKEIQKVADKIGAYKYVRTSAKENDGVTTVFHEAIRSCLYSEKDTSLKVKGRRRSKTGGLFGSFSNSDDDVDPLIKVKK